MDEERTSHWDTVYSTKGDAEVSWFEETPALSLELIRATGLGADAAIIDIGGGASRLVDRLLAAGHTDLSVLDLSAVALARARSRLGEVDRVDWVVADVTRWLPSRQYELWHDRAALHFLTDPKDQKAYVANLKRALRPGGFAIIGTFAPDGPERCSSLPVVRYGDETLSRLVGDEFDLVASRRHQHSTPGGSIQRFQFCMFRRE